MKHTLKAEAIGYNDIKQCMAFDRFCRTTLPEVGNHFSGFGALLPWVAEITGKHPVYKFQRQFLRGQTDYLSSNSKGSRGVYIYFFLDENKIYEVYERVSWKRSDRYFLRIEHGYWNRLTKAQVLECLENVTSL